ncbi:MAG TPA: hypothetical protein VNV66_13245 [Pilimelia sp.]|nr:hypothetical protein [Pilimelia sp.]
MEIDELMARFAALPGARVGRGPDHPRMPEPAVGEAVDGFLRRFPEVARDHGYVAFLRRYAGAAIDNEERHEIVDILGFSNVSSDLIEMDGPVVDEHGFLIFAQVVRHLIEGGALRDTQEYDYAFDTTGARAPGVYWLYSSSRQPETFDEHARAGFAPAGEAFTGWLSRIVGSGGFSPPPAGAA